MREEQNSVFGFLKRYSFYLILLIGLLCFLAVGVVSMIPNESEDKTDVVEQEKDTKADREEKDQNPDDQQPVSDPEDEPSEPVNATDPEDDSYVIPVTGVVSVRYSGTAPVFSETMQEWYMHQGVDYVTTRSEPVYAVFGGTVESVYDDEMMGNTVVVKQNDGIRTVYQSLSPAVKVTEGQAVEKGTLIGMTGTSSDSECDEGIHLHLAMIQDGGYVDPLEMIG